jgi:hypothetical protein
VDWWEHETSSKSRSKMRRKCRYLDKEVVSTKHEHKYKAPHCDSVNSLGVPVHLTPCENLGWKRTHTERTQVKKRGWNLDEIWMKCGRNDQNLKLVEIKFFWRFRFSISTSAYLFGSLGLATSPTCRDSYWKSRVSYLFKHLSIFMQDEILSLGT